MPTYHRQPEARPGQASAYQSVDAPTPRPVHPPAPRPVGPPPPGPQSAQPQQRKKSNVGIWIGLSIIGLSVVVSVGFGILWIVALVSQIDSETITGTQDVELEGAQWTVSVPVDAPDTTVTVTDGEGRDVEIRPFPSAGVDAEGASDIEGATDAEGVNDAQGSSNADDDSPDWVLIGTMDIPADGTYTVDAGEGTTKLDSTDIVGVLAAHGLLFLSFIAGGILFFIGVLVTLFAFVFRVS